MSYLDKLREAQSLRDIAKILGFKPSALAFILYHLPDSHKYTAFEVPKRSGESRQIKAPCKRLRLVQRRLANVLYICISEIEKAGTPRRALNHGFVEGHSIITNASVHKRRRYVFNLDLEDFFPSINFGRVRGFFIKDNRFNMNEDAATVIAQIACHDNELPQGSPCSPVISNLVGYMLDVRLARLAKEHKCTYSRYADDLTFSTNQKQFPKAIAEPVEASEGRWIAGKRLVSRIENTGFKVNHSKTRMQFNDSRQMVTGLTVNQKANIRSEYYRIARAMCHSLFNSGKYYRFIPTQLVEHGAAGDDEAIKFEYEEYEECNVLEGILSHIFLVKNKVDQRDSFEKKKNPTAIRELYRRFLFYKHFVALDKPLIVPEGKTDSIYLKAALSSLASKYPSLCGTVEGEFVYYLRFMSFSKTVRNVMQLGNGTEDLKHLILKYNKNLKSYEHKPMGHPVIVLSDNDEGAKEIFGVIKEVSRSRVSIKNTDPFYKLGGNLYFVKTPEIGVDCESRIEDLFEKDLLETELNGKKFDADKKHGEKGKYGKQVFAESVVKKNVENINFDGFRTLLDRFAAVLEDYYSGE